ncbi:hypothetical protein BEH94_05090 [Candidatus Altiarchaeales archaeon WOR_SM1_SCG]|nr:hypothetical protein BEH94_05090 [Candidatus Altiarchaeales archaeon WOR_SM1_SCG]
MFVIKLGGSLTKDKKILANLCREIEKLTKKFDLLIVPGGGEFADIVREYDKKFNLSQEISHRMAVLAMDQTGFLISGFFNDNNNKVKILIPSKIFLELPESELEHSWDVTSDSISAYLAGKLNAEKLIILTDVCGLYDSDPKKNQDAKLFKKVNLNEIKNFHDSCVDKKFHEFLKTPCCIINGKFPGRISAALENKEFVGTEIVI